MPVHSKPFRYQEIIAAERGSTPESSNGFGPPDAAATVSSLKDAITAGYHGLDPILEAITDAARILTGASGTALAMWKDGAMVCRARSGETAPPLGAQLSAETGISGECLRSGMIQHCADAETDARVDAEACRSRGLRSIAVFPIQSTRETNGILLAFSTQQSAFADSHISLLLQLASLAELARAAKLQGLSSAAPSPTPGGYGLPLFAPAKPASTAARPASDSNSSTGIDRPQPSTQTPLDEALASPKHQPLYRSRPIVFGALALAAVALLAFAAWLGWRGPHDAESRARPVAPRSTRIPVANTAAPDTVIAERAGQHLPDDPIWKPNPGGEAMSPSGSRSSADNSVKLASQLDKSAADSITASIIISNRVPRTQSPPASRAVHPESRPADIASAEPPELAAGATTQSGVGDVLSPTVSLPAPPVEVSQGVSGGQLLSSTLPEYPASARRIRLEGEVVLQATIAEDGSVGAIKVIAGPKLLTQSAVNAVKTWRYQPFQLNGKPMPNQTRIVLDFKLPSGAASQ